MGKNKTELIDQIQTEFAACARRRGRTETVIAQVWGLVAGFRGYAFCKAHSTAYGVEAYQSAWLKRYYPAEFMAAVLTNGKGFYHPLVYILECHRLGIPLLPPAINQPGPAFTVVSLDSNGGGDQTLSTTGLIGLKAIRIPALLVKGLTRRTKDAIVRERARRPFSALADFFLRVQPLPEEMDPLIRVGAFDEFGKPRTAQYWAFKALAYLPINRCNLPAKILGGLTFQRYPAPLFIDGVREFHHDLFKRLRNISNAAHRHSCFMDYMSVHFCLEELEEQGYQEKMRLDRAKANYLRVMRGWMFDSNSRESAVLKGWVESRFGLTPRYHHGPIRHHSDPTHRQYEQDRASGLYNTNALEAQLDLLYGYSQYELNLLMPQQTHITVYRGINHLDEYEVIRKLDAPHGPRTPDPGPRHFSLAAYCCS